jgi:cell division protease FtsH
VDEQEAFQHKKPMNGGKHVKKIFKFELDLKNIFLIVIIGFLAISIFSSFSQYESSQVKKPLSTVLQDIKNNKVKKISIEENKLTVEYKDGKIATTSKEINADFYTILHDANINPKQVTIEVKDSLTSGAIFNFILNAAGIIIPILFFLWIFRQARGAQDSVFSFGNSRAKLFNKEQPKILFSNVAGVDEAKNELKEVVDFLKNPKKYQALGARTPKGVLLVGPSGTGKTLLAKAVAGEAQVAFFSMAGSEFMEMLVGVGASRVRDLFGTAKKNAPAIIFIDEIDAIGRMRSRGVMGGHDEREQTLNQILVEMDGFTPNDNVMVLAATNRGDMLDPALLRPGRFDRRVTLDMPDIEGRKAILAIHQKGKPIDAGVDWEKVAQRTVGFSGADLENMLNEAAIRAASEGKKSLDMNDLEEAATKVKMGPQRKRIQQLEDKKITAYHEGGHALVTFFSEGMDPVHRISIVSRGMSLGYTLIPPTLDRTHETKSHLLNLVTTLLGGRAAEELIFNEMTTGASDDIKRATKIAQEMVVSFGMSELGPINLGAQYDEDYGYVEQQHVSEETQKRIDAAVKKITDEAYAKAQNLLKNNRAKLDLVAEELLKIETMDGERFKQIMGVESSSEESRV